MQSERKEGRGLIAHGLRRQFNTHIHNLGCWFDWFDANRNTFLGVHCVCVWLARLHKVLQFILARTPSPLPFYTPSRRISQCLLNSNKQEGNETAETNSFCIEDCKKTIAPRSLSPPKIVGNSRHHHVCSAVEEVQRYKCVCVSRRTILFNFSNALRFAYVLKDRFIANIITNEMKPGNERRRHANVFW